MTDYDGMENNHVTGRINGLHDGSAYNQELMSGDMTCSVVSGGKITVVHDIHFCHM